MAIETTVKPIDFYRFMTAGALKDGLQLKAKGQSINNLARFAMGHEQVSHTLWAHLFEASPSKFSQYIHFPSSLINRPELVTRLQTIPIEKLVMLREGAKGKVAVLDLGRLDILVRMLSPKGVTEEEIENLSILGELGKIYLKHYLFMLQKGAAVRGGDETEKARSQASLDELKQNIPWIIARLTSVNKPYRTEIANHLRDVERLHNGKKTSAADVSLVTAWKKLERYTDEMEKERLSTRENEKERTAKLNEKGIGELRLSDLGIEKLPDGTWRATQKGYKKYPGGAMVLEEKKTKVKRDALLRRTDHIVNSISGEIRENQEHIDTFENAKKKLQQLLDEAIKYPLFAPDEELIVAIDLSIVPSLEHYARSLKRKKLMVFDRMETTLSLIDSLMFKQAISMLNIAINDLKDRNAELTRQKKWFETQGKVEFRELTGQTGREEIIKGKIDWTLARLFEFSIGDAPRIRGIVKWMGDDLMLLTRRKEHLPHLKSTEICFKEASKALKQAANWSERKPSWIGHQRIPDENRDEIMDNNVRNSVIKAAKWLIIGKWCMAQALQSEENVKTMANIWKKIGSEHTTVIEKLKKLK